MGSRIEYIEEYIVETHDNPDGYNPPSFKWNDNHGELVRCRNCRFREESRYGYLVHQKCNLSTGLNRIVFGHEFCSNGIKKEE